MLKLSSYGPLLFVLATLKSLNNTVRYFEFQLKLNQILINVVRP